jgi:Cytochrome c554 and c-prime
MGPTRISAAAVSIAILVGLTLASSVPTSHAQQAASATPPVSRAEFAGDATCRACHAAQFDSYQHTAHHLTSQEPSAQTIAGKFTPGSNILTTINPLLTYHMEEKGGSFYQIAVTGESPKASTRRERFDFVIGSGGKGQTYLYWRGDALFELPVSYWTELGQWVNSPGYLDGVADFDRPIVPRCFECHATYIHALSASPNDFRYEKTGYVLGISCERCHGPGRQHVELFQSQLHGAAQTKIVNPAKLPRDVALGVCAQCHGGLGKSLVPAFSYVPGEPLEKYIELQQPTPDQPVDVHGNQIALLERSKCFQSSPSMTCWTCHNEHAPEKPAASYVQRCLTCHKVESCGLFTKLGEKIATRCIDCHMPVQDSHLIVSDDNGRQVNARVRNHWIKVYSELRDLP